MKRRRESPIVMSVVEFVVKTRPIVLSLSPVDKQQWACVADGARFFYSRGKPFGMPSMKGFTSTFNYYNGRMPADGLEFALAIAVDGLNELADKDGNLPDEIEQRDLTTLIHVCDGYLNLIREHAHEIAQLKTQLEEARRK